MLRLREVLPRVHGAPGARTIRRAARARTPRVLLHVHAPLFAKEQQLLISAHVRVVNRVCVYVGVCCKQGHTGVNKKHDHDQHPCTSKTNKHNYVTYMHDVTSTLLKPALLYTNI